MKDNLMCNYSDVLATEIVICDRNVSLEAHRELFKFDADKYILCDSPPVNCLEETRGSVSKVHISLLWENILSVALWKGSVSLGETMLLLKEAGLEDAELKPFRQGSINDIFPVLYYGKNFDVLRKLCNYAKKVAQDQLRQYGIQINCHMVSEETGRIVASSL